MNSYMERAAAVPGVHGEERDQQGVGMLRVGAGQGIWVVCSSGS